MLLLALALVQSAPQTTFRPMPHGDRQARFDRMFRMADTDHNGQLSESELMAARERMRARRMMRRQAMAGSPVQGFQSPR